MTVEDPNSTDDGWPESTDADVAELADFYRYLAEAEFDGYCDLYAGLARSIADDEPVLERIAAMASTAKMLPILAFAAVHDLLLADPDAALAAAYRGDRGAPSDPWPLFRDFVVTRAAEVSDLVARRSIQTNEVGRSSVLLPAFTSVHRSFGLPLSLIELGPSAGLNLAFDRFGYTYDDGVGIGDAGATVQLRCEVRGPVRPPRGSAPPPVRSRVGIDLAPVDITDPDACRWLEACIWPRLTDRSHRLRAAIELARSDPPDLRTGNALEGLADLVRGSDPDTVVCVYATWVLAYFSRDERVRLGELLDELGAERPLALVTSEYPGIAPGVDRPSRDASGDGRLGASLVGLQRWSDGRRTGGPVAWCHAHGQWIEWFDPSTGETR